MKLWHKGHGLRTARPKGKRAAVSPQSFPNYDMAELLPVPGVRDVGATLREGDGTGRGLRGI